jgi:hypothetical protein
MARFRDRMNYRVLRSPLAPAIKAGRRIIHASQIGQRARLAATLPCDEECIAAGDELDREGMVRLDHLVDRALLQEMAAAASERLSRGDRTLAQAPAGTVTKTFWSRLLDDDLVDGRMPAASPYARFAVQPRILGMLSRIMGGLPQIDYVLLTLSLPSDAPLAVSQLWHKDYDDTRTIKVFVYLTDVAGEDDGPFTFVPGPMSDKVGFTLRSHMPDEQAFRDIPADAACSMVAPALSVFAVETSRCLHMGSRVAAGHRRLLYTATYTTYPRIMGTAPDSFLLTGQESELERAVLAPGAGA